jgi:hypothetical protein
VSTSAASAVTVTFSDTFATAISKSAVRVSETLTTTVCDCDWKPLISIVSA